MPTGPKPKPHLQAVREGTFRSDRNSEGVRLPPDPPVEPDWEERLPGDGAEESAVRQYAASVWHRIVPALVSSAGLTAAQQETAVEYCVTAARIWQGERALSRDGVTIRTERGMVKHPWTTVSSSYRSHFRSLAGELGLTPSSATRVQAPEGDPDTDDVFD